MVAVKFNIDVVDSVSQNRYIASTEFVEVSEEFAERLRDAGTDVEFEDEDYNGVGGNHSNEDLMTQFKAHVDELEKEHQEQIEVLESEIQKLKDEKESILNERSHFETQLDEAHGLIESLKASQVQQEPSEKDKVREEYEALIGAKAGNKSIETMKAEIAAFNN